MGFDKISGQGSQCRVRMEFESPTNKRKETEKYAEHSRRTRPRKANCWVKLFFSYADLWQCAYSCNSDRDHLDESMRDKRLGVYTGIDPTAPSLHIGHMVPLMTLFWMYLNGYHAVSLLRGATSKIGDPTDRLKSREKTHSSVKTENMTRIHYQLKRLWVNVEAYGKKYGYERDWAWHRELENNSAWWNKLPMLEVLQTLGPGMRIGSMLARDTYDCLLYLPRYNVLVVYFLTCSESKTK